MDYDKVLQIEEDVLTYLSNRPGASASVNALRAELYRQGYRVASKEVKEALRKLELTGLISKEEGYVRIETFPVSKFVLARRLDIVKLRKLMHEGVDVATEEELRATAVLLLPNTQEIVDLAWKLLRKEK
ncbi:MAG: hypothetical protein DRO13_05750 [Thermoprotei archaeon]|nr:MAG: hypothetical protein DRO13_05750 [Thermoprotei archaeon]